MPAVLETKGLSKNYGSIRAVSNLDLTVESGSVFGILGPNGSGKTTTLGIVLDVIKNYSGNYVWFSQEPDAKLRKRIGSILEAPNFYPYLTGYQNLMIVAKIKGAPFSEIMPVLALAGLSKRRNSNYQTYSLGMKQRLAMASALLGNPDVLVLDEPTNGFDPQGIAEIRQLIKDIGKEGKTIILASHLLDEVEKVCTHVAILKSGKLLTSGRVSDVLADEDQIEVSAKDMTKLEAEVKEFNALKSIDKSKDRLILKFKDKIDTEALNRFLFERGVVLDHLNLKKKSLEKQFLELTEGND